MLNWAARRRRVPRPAVCHSRLITAAGALWFSIAPQPLKINVMMSEPISVTLNSPHVAAGTPVTLTTSDPTFVQFNESPLNNGATHNTSLQPGPTIDTRLVIYIATDQLGNQSVQPIITEIHA